MMGFLAPSYKPTPARLCLPNKIDVLHGLLGAVSRSIARILRARRPSGLTRVRMPRDFSVLKSREIAWCNSARQASHSASQVRGAAADERPHGCASGGYAFLHVLSDGHTVATAVEIATQVTPKIDVVSSLRLLFCLSASRARNVHNRQRCHKCHKAPREFAPRRRRDGSRRVILRKSLSLYTSTWVHPGRSRSSRARYCSTLVSYKG